MNYETKPDECFQAEEVFSFRYRGFHIVRFYPLSHSHRRHFDFIQLLYMPDCLAVI